MMIQSLVCIFDWLYVRFIRSSVQGLNLFYYLQWLVLATVLSACLADEEAQPTASPQILIQNDYHRLENYRLRQGLEHLRHDLNIPSNPHRHLQDPYRHNKPYSENLGYRRNENDNRRDKYDNPRDVYDDRRDDWRDLREKHEKQWWTDKDKIEHVDDDQDIQGPVILRTIKSHEDVSSPIRYLLVIHTKFLKKFNARFFCEAA